MLTEIADLTKWDKRDLLARVEQCSEETVELLRTYGAGVLTRYISHDLISQVDSEADPVVEELSDQALQLRILRELAFLPNENADFNLVVQTALEGIQRGIRMRRAIVFLKSRERGCLMPRFISSPDFNQIKREFVVSLKGSPNIFTHVLNSRQPVWVDNLNAPKWRAYLDGSVRQLVSNDGFFIAPIIWGKHCVGLFYADRKDPSEQADHPLLSEDDFMAFTLFAQQTNICFSLIIKNTER